MIATRRGSLALFAALTLGLSACGGGDSGDEAAGGGTTGSPIVIATTNFTETKILASMYEQALEAKGVAAEVKELTTREVIVPALQSGEVQLTPEYLGSLTEFLNGKANGPDAEQVATGDVDASFAAAQELAAAGDLTLLTPSPAQDQNAFAITSAFAAETGASTLSELATYSEGNPVTLGGPPECPERPFCQIGLEEVYGLQIDSFLPLDAGGQLTIQAINQGRINVGLVFSSSGSVTANDLVVLDDDQGLQTAENIVPAMHTPAVTDQITETLDAVSAALTTEDLQALNAAVEIDRQDPESVAEQFLSDKGLL